MKYSGWKLTDLKSEVDLLTGHPFKSNDYTENVDDILLLRGDNIAQGYLRWDGVKRWSSEKIEELESYFLKEDDIVVAMDRPWIESGLKYAYVSPKDLPSLLVQRVSRLRANKSLNQTFLRYIIGGLDFTKHILSVQTGTAVPHISSSQIKEFEFFLPPLEEQKRIADVLSCLDAKIDNLRRQNETLEEVARSIFKHWFIDFEFPNADGKPYKSFRGAMIRSDLGDIPEGWRVGKLGDVVTVNPQSIDKNYPHHIIEYVDISSVGIGTLENTTQYKLSEAPSRARRLVEHGDVIWSGVRPNRKSYLFICKPIDNLIVSTGFVVLSPKKIPSSYLYSWVTTSMFVDYLTLNASGSAYPAVKAEHFEIADILLPSISILDKFHLLIDPMRIKTHDNSLQIQTLTKTRDALLPKLMSGQLRVKD